MGDAVPETQNMFDPWRFFFTVNFMVYTNDYDDYMCVFTLFYYCLPILWLLDLRSR